MDRVAILDELPIGVGALHGGFEVGERFGFDEGIVGPVTDEDFCSDVFVIGFSGGQWVAVEADDA